MRTNEAYNSGRHGIAYKIGVSALGVVAVFGLSACAGGKGSAAPEGAARQADTYGGVGYDASFPQCGMQLPRKADFGIIGANGERPNVPNPCYDDLMRQAKKLAGATNMANASVYVTAANPGQVKEQASFWPDSGSNAYGECQGANDSACSFEYGVHNAEQDMVTIETNAPSKKVNEGLIWIDVEPQDYSYEEGGTPQALEANRAMLEGMASVFISRGYDIGIYGSSDDWRNYVGALPSGSALYKVPMWVRNSNCEEAAFTGGEVLLAQTPAAAGGIDTNRIC